MEFLVDAYVLSEPTKTAPVPNVLEWLGRHEHEIAIDPVILDEVRFGILLLPKGKRRTRLEHWFDTGVQRLHCLPWEAETGLQWAQLLATLRAKGRAMPIKDSLIAATALVHDLTFAVAFANCCCARSMRWAGRGVARRAAASYTAARRRTRSSGSPRASRPR